jgi:hypothetical protein
MTKQETPPDTQGEKQAKPAANEKRPPRQRTKTDYVELAKERNARVILHNTPDTYPLTDMARYADQGIRRLRNRIMISLAPKDALPLLDEYNDALFQLHTIVSKICAVTNVRYRTPRALAQILGEQTPEAADKAKAQADHPSGAMEK